MRASSGTQLSGNRVPLAFEGFEGFEVFVVAGAASAATA